jgi:hypothetical protein
VLHKSTPIKDLVNTVRKLRAGAPSEATGVVSERVQVWVELYPGYGPESVVGVGEERSTIEEIQLSDLLSVMDRA